jgi:hypothetical protein
MISSLGKREVGRDFQNAKVLSENEFPFQIYNQLSDEVSSSWGKTSCDRQILRAKAIIRGIGMPIGQ